MTGADGQVVLPALAPGSYEIVAPGHPDAQPVGVTVADGVEAVVVLNLL